MMNTRKGKKAAGKEAKIVRKPSGDTKIFFINNDILETDSCPTIITLKHPGTGKSAKFIISLVDNTIYELLQFNEPKRSWFINDTVCGNGNLYLTTKIDPLFLVLPYMLNETKTQAVPLDHVLKDNNYPHICKLVDLITKEQLSLIADAKGSDDIKAFKYNEEKTNKWLTKKCKKLIKVLKIKKIHVGIGAISTNYVKSEKIESTIDEAETLKYAFGIISEYLSEELSESLKTILDIPDDTPAKSSKRKSLSTLEYENIKKVKAESLSSETEEITEIKADKVVEKKSSAKEKAMAKAASGTKNIASFFMKKK